MASLFLLLFLMAETKKVEVQQPQVPVQQVEQKFDRYSMGYTDRPINQRKQVTNTYLDGIKAIKSEQTIADVTLTDITGYTFTKTGNLPFENIDSIKIPVSGTYIISAVFDWNNDITQGLHYVTINGTQTLIQVQDNMSAFQNVFLTSVENLEKGDVIAVEVFQESGASQDVTVKLTVTKIS